LRRRDQKIDVKSLGAPQAALPLAKNMRVITGLRDGRRRTLTRLHPGRNSPEKII
jgi:hypothetical protein